MKKLFFSLAAVLCLSSFAMALEPFWTSSNTATADTVQSLCGQYVVGTSTVVYHAAVHGVVISSGTAGELVTLYNSSFTATGSKSLGPINAAAVVAPIYYDIVFPNGLSYTTTTGGAQVQILYQCY